MTIKYHVVHLCLITASTLLILKKRVRSSALFFAEQCSVIPNKSVLPPQLTWLTENLLANCYFSKKDILQIIRNLDSNKAHGHDMISIPMLKLCGDSICKPLVLIFKTCLRNGRFPLEWKKVNVVPIHNKGDKQTIKNYRPVSLLPICEKIFERLLYDTMFDFIYFLQINLDSDWEILASINFFQLIMKS